MLTSLSLENFRNYKERSLDFSEMTILVGPNGVGKTNIMEAIYLMSTGRSWRTSRETQAVRWGQDFARVTVGASDIKERELEMVIQRNESQSYPQKKILKINGVKKKLIELLGCLPAVLFSPEEIQLVEGTPGLRRRFLDILLCQVSRKYALALLEYLKILKGRNKLLYFIKIGRSKLDELLFWDEKLIILGSQIILKRAELIEDLNKNIGQTYQIVSGEGETLRVKYKKAVEAENFRKVIANQRHKEIESALTLFGPHRDDLVFLLEGRDMATFGSRGEYRSVVLSLKMAELAYLEKKIEIPPILLLDDIFSELDKTRRRHLGKIIVGHQTIITTTDMDHIEKDLRDKAKIVALET